MRSFMGLILSAVVCAPLVVGCGGKSGGGGQPLPPPAPPTPPGGPPTFITSVGSSADTFSSLVNQTYSYDLSNAVTGGTKPFTFGIISGSLPTGLSLSPSGIVSGTPTTNGSSSVTFTVSDATNRADNHTYTYNIYSPLALSPNPPPNATSGQNYSVTFGVVGGAPGTTIQSVTTNSSVPGLTASSNTSLTLSGNPTTPGSYPLAIVVTSTPPGGGSTQSTFNVTLVVN